MTKCGSWDIRSLLFYLFQEFSYKHFYKRTCRHSITCLYPIPHTDTWTVKNENIMASLLCLLHIHNESRIQMSYQSKCAWLDKIRTLCHKKLFLMLQEGWTRTLFRKKNTVTSHPMYKYWRTFDFILFIMILMLVRGTLHLSGPLGINYFLVKSSQVSGCHIVCWREDTEIERQYIKG